jgi:putative selenium metabolism protein SsnA
MNILIENAGVVVDPLGDTLLTGQAVAIEGTEIAAVGPIRELTRRYPQAERIDGTGSLLLPGLIDAHTHLYSALSLGMPAPASPPRNFPQILERVWWRFDKALRDEDNEVSALVGSILSLRSGITTILDHHASPHAVDGSLSLLAEGVERVGLRACLAYEVSDRDGPEIRDRGIAENRRFIESIQRREDGLLAGLFGLHAVFSLADETLRRCAAAAHELEVGCHMHLAEHEPEVSAFARDHEASIAEFLAEVGILGPQTLVAHTVHVDREDVEVLKQTRTFNVHNPKSNMGNGVGIAPVADMLEWGQPVGLGSDGYYDIPQELVTVRLLQNVGQRDPSAFSDTQALQLAYEHNVRFAESLFGCRLGKIASGYAADVILIDYRPATPIEPWNLSQHIVAALSGGSVRTALVAGRVVLRDGEVTGVDEAGVWTRARAQATELWARL